MLEPPKDGETVEQYLIRNWVELAVNSFIYFKQYGRGMMFYDFTGEVPEVFDYKTESIVAEAVLIDPGFKSLLNDVRSYDPKQEVVFAVRANEKELVLRTGPPGNLPSPERLYEIHQRKKKRIN